MKKVSNGFIVQLILIVLALLAIGGGVYFYHARSQSSSLAVSSLASTTPGRLASSTPTKHCGTAMGPNGPVEVCDTYSGPDRVY